MTMKRCSRGTETARAQKDGPHCGENAIISAPDVWDATACLNLAGSAALYPRNCRLRGGPQQQAAGGMQKLCLGGATNEAFKTYV